MTVKNTKTGYLCRPLKRSPPDVVYTPFDVISSADLEDIVEKIGSANRLWRWAQAEEDLLGPEPTVPYRSYGSKMGMQGTKEEEFDQDKKPMDQTFGCALGGSLAMSPTTLCSKFVEMAQGVERGLLPSLIVTLGWWHILPFADRR